MNECNMTVNEFMSAYIRLNGRGYTSMNGQAPKTPKHSDIQISEEYVLRVEAFNRGEVK